MPGILLVTLATVVTFLGLHGLLFFHELGHLMTGELFHMVVRKVQVGVGPRLLRFKLVGVQWEWRLIPFIGFVSFEPASPGDNSESASALYFDTAPKWMRLTILAAGPLASLVVAAVLFASTTVFFPPRFVAEPFVVSKVDAGSRAEKWGYRLGDVVFAFNAQTGELLSILDRAAMLKVPRATVWVLRRSSDGKKTEIREGPWNPLDFEGPQVDGWIQSVVYLPGVGGALPGADSPAANSYLSFVINKVKRVLMGPGAALLSFAWLSLSIGIMNALPFYPLDGGQILTTLAEGVVPQRALLAVRLASLAFVLGFILAAEFSGLLKDISGYVRHLIP